MKKLEVRSQKLKVQGTRYKVRSTKLKAGAILVAVLTISVSLFAQKKDSAQFSFSLKQCIDYALQNQNSLKNATLNEAIANAKVGEVVGTGLPQVNGSVQLSHNDPLRRMFLLPQSAQMFSPPGTPVSDGKVVALPNFFQLASSADAGISINQLIFSGSYIVGLQAVKTYKELASKATTQTKTEITESVTKAYYMVLINEERLKLFEKNVARLDSLLMQTKLMNENGMVENIDVQRMQVAYNNLATEKEKFNNLLSLSKILLKYQISMPLENDLSLTEKIADYKVDNAPADTYPKPNYSNRIEYSMLESQKKLKQLDLKNNKAANLPTIGAFGNIGVFSQSPKFDYFTESNLWYNYGLFGASVNVPIFSGLGRHRTIQQAQLNLKIAENDLASMERVIDLQVKTAEITLKNSLSTLNFQDKNIELAKEVARVAKLKYQQGVGSSLEITTAESDLLEAQTNYYNALYDVLIAKVDYDKATGAIVK